MPVARRNKRRVPANPNTSQSPSRAGSSSVASMPPIANSPYMFYHGGVEDVLLAPPPAEKSGKKGRKKSKADAAAAAAAAAAQLEQTLNEEEDGNSSNDEDGENNKKKGKPSELCLAFQANNSEFTDGVSQSCLKELNQRNQKQGKLKQVNGFLDKPKAANLATFHRLVAKMVLRDATTRNKAGGVDSNASLNKSSSPVVGGNKGGSTMNRANSFAEPSPSNLSMDASAFVDSESMSTFGTGAGGSSLMRRANEVQINSLLQLLRENYQITSSNLLSTLGDGFRSMNEKLLQSSPTVAAADGSIPFLVLMDLMDRYVNGVYALDTRHACFAVFDVHQLRCLTMKTLRGMRGKKAEQIRAETNGGSFAMLKVILDTFANSEELSTTLTKEQVVPIFDVDQGVLVEGFMEEIMRQIAQNEFGAERAFLLAN